MFRHNYKPQPVLEQVRNEVLLERKDLASGVYYLTLVVGEQQLSKKVLVQ